MTQLIQKYLFKEIGYEIKHDCLHFRSTGFFKDLEYDISFEEFTDKIIHESKMKSLPILIIFCSILFLIISIVSQDPVMIFFTSIVCGLILLLFYSTRSKTATLLLTDNRSIVIDKKKPDEESVILFINDLQNTIKYYLKRKYATIYKNLPIEPQMENYIILKNRNIISEEEFNALKYKLLKFDTDDIVGLN